MNQPEVTILLLCCRVYLQSSSISTLCTFISGHSIDWQRVYKLCARHRIRPVAFHVLNRLKGIVPPEALQPFKAYCREFSVFAFDRKREADHIVARLKQHGAAARFYKGMDFSQLIYGDIAMREFTDMDIIIREDQVPTVVSVMQAEGYEMHQEKYFSIYPDHFKDHIKEVVFGKRCARGKWLSFEFHYRPPETLTSVQYHFNGLLGKDYLSGRPFTHQDYYRLMLVNNGASDFYPHLRSLLDMALLYRHGPYRVVPKLQGFEDLWMQLASDLLGIPAYATGPVPEKTYQLLRKRLLEDPPPAENKFLQLAFIRLTFMTTLKAKYAVFTQYLRFLLRPNGEDIMRVRLPYFFLYYFTKPFRLTFGLFRRSR
ncbi:nucleotidyltransferase family protein [Chitinophaga filiformis]|uniref:nucleotidyltransferase family protein n=1 Tax=Chitinophaga filiformis TaxID=104663 RepID=UPI001F478E02|nr:nucleotidyltransferase family protein [Chitinophaga filiformis]MCF6405284.1 nucleotidyltransferase family protein [Chitinophaga filiformis]